MIWRESPHQDDDKRNGKKQNFEYNHHGAAYSIGAKPENIEAPLQR